MSPHFNLSSFGFSGGQEYLDANIQTASPARLRLMLIERGVEVARQVAHAWRESKNNPASQELSGANEYSLKLLEIINELLSGVTGDQHEVCRKVADLYVFLAKHLITAEESSDASAIDEIRLVLETEAETWRMVCANEVPTARRGTMVSPHPETAGGLNLQA
jgi:flagellar protein FliS